jgi:hypothetical protein
VVGIRDENNVFVITMLYERIVLDQELVTLSNH